MKAKQLAKQFIQSPYKEKLLHEIVKTMYKDLIKLISARQPKTEHGLYNVCAAGDKKFIVFASLVNVHYKKAILSTDDFKMMLKEVNPELYTIYIKSQVLAINLSQTP